MSKTILSLFDYSGNWSQPYRDNGYEVIQIDLKFGDDAVLWPSKPSKLPRLPREFNDVIDYLPIYGILSACPCTYFSGSGALRKRTDEQIKEGLALVDACLRIIYATKPKFWALENPVGKLRKWIGPPKFIFQPYEFGDNYSKRTCLWGCFNIPKKNPIVPTNSNMIMKLGGKSERTKELRSVTPINFAQAFFEANQ